VPQQPRLDLHPQVHDCAAEMIRAIVACSGRWIPASWGRVESSWAGDPTRDSAIKVYKKRTYARWPWSSWELGAIGASKHIGGTPRTSGSTDTGPFKPLSLPHAQGHPISQLATRHRCNSLPDNNLQRCIELSCPSNSTRLAPNLTIATRLRGITPTGDRFLAGGRGCRPAGPTRERRSALPDVVAQYRRGGTSDSENPPVLAANRSLPTIILPTYND
jgi:hypothetical protein